MGQVGKETAIFSFEGAAQDLRLEMWKNCREEEMRDVIGNIFLQQSLMRS